MAVSTPDASNGTNKSNDEVHDVCVVGAGPAGLMLSVVLARLGLSVKVLDERPDQTSAGRADGIQPKTIETLQMLGLGDELLRQGVRVYDICMWKTAPDGSLTRQGRETHYPADVVDVLHPFILLCHQGMVEKMLLDDMSLSGLTVERNRSFQTYQRGEDGTLRIESLNKTDGITNETTRSRYLVGCDGARSAVRKAIPGTYSEGTPHNSVWGVLDGELDTDFPDIWSKTLVYSEEHGSLLIIPRERNMTRLYIEMKNSTSAKDLGQEFVMEQARRVLKPFKVDWKTVEWFGNYAVSQRVAARFSDPECKAFIAGDASHSHSPKAAQGLNTSVHDSWNLGWKLNLALRGLCSPVLVESYEDERKKIAHDLIDFDLEHANQIAGGDSKQVAENFRKNTRFISGVGVEYGLNVLNQGAAIGRLVPGRIMPPGMATRFIDANPVHVQLDIPMLGQFRIYFIVPDLVASSTFLRRLSDLVANESSLFSRLTNASKKSYIDRPRAARTQDQFQHPQRYTGASQLFTYALITSTDKNRFELATLPSLFASSPWTVYVDDGASLSGSPGKGQSCIQKWIGGDSDPNAVTVLNVRPDGYVGSVHQWQSSDITQADEAAQWLESYYGGFLAAAV